MSRMHPAGAPPERAAAALPLLPGYSCHCHPSPLPPPTRPRCSLEVENLRSSSAPELLAAQREELASMRAEVERLKEVRCWAYD